jgi:CRP-like cAMP-binding protein
MLVPRSPEEDIRSYLRRFAAPPEAQVDAFISAGRRRLLAKGAFFTETGDTNLELGFLHSGIVRYCVSVAASGEDVTKDFSAAPSFILSFASAVRDEPARVAICAVEECVLTHWPFRMFQELFDRDVEWQKLGRKVAEWLYIRKEDRELAFLLLTPEERYDALLAEFASVVDRIPQHLLASYVGIAPESLSRLRRRRNNSKSS